jgi:hypothetical protein
MTNDEKPAESSRLLNLLSCPICGIAMTLTQIRPGDPGYDRLTFRCDTCNSSDTIVVKTKRDE